MKQREMYEANRAAMVEDRMKELLAGSIIEADNYDPYHKPNFEEFIQNIDENDLIRVMECCKRGMVGSAGAIIKGCARRYWKELAKKRAESETPSVEELFECGAEDAANARRDR